MAYAIRPFDPADAEALAAITLAAIEAVGSQKYTKEQVAAWTARHPGAERFLKRARNGARIWVAVDVEDHPVAYALLEVDAEGDGHLDMLYCHPEHTRRGLADELLAVAEQHALASGVARLYTEASDLARAAFGRAGYTVQHRRDFEIEGPDGSVPIHNFAMEKHLT